MSDDEDENENDFQEFHQKSREINEYLMKERKGKMECEYNDTPFTNFRVNYAPEDPRRFGCGENKENQYKSVNAPNEISVKSECLQADNIDSDDEENEGLYRGSTESFKELLLSEDESSVQASRYNENELSKIEESDGSNESDCEAGYLNMENFLNCDVLAEECVNIPNRNSQLKSIPLVKCQKLLSSEITELFCYIQNISVETANRVKSEMIRKEFQHEQVLRGEHEPPHPTIVSQGNRSSLLQLRAGVFQLPHGGIANPLPNATSQSMHLGGTNSVAISDGIENPHVKLEFNSTIIPSTQPAVALHPGMIHNWVIPQPDNSWENLYSEQHGEPSQTALSQPGSSQLEGGQENLGIHFISLRTENFKSTENMAKFNWNSSLESTLIDLIHGREAFWNYKHTAYHKRINRTSLLIEFLSEMQSSYPEDCIALTTQEIQRKWSIMKKTMRRIVAKERTKKSDSCKSTNTRVWVHQEAMRFLSGVWEEDQNINSINFGGSDFSIESKMAYSPANFEDCVKREERETVPEALMAELNNLESSISEINSVSKYECRLCNYMTARKIDVRKHIKSVHLKIKTHCCSLCDYKTSRKYRLQIHINSVHLKLTFKCPHCDYEGSVVNNLKTHVNRVHLKIGQYKCSDCDFRVAVKSELIQHVNTVHLKLKPFKCLECDYVASAKGNLKNHVEALHRKLKQYQCPHCEYQTNHKSDRQKHMDGFHLKLKKFQCAKCSYQSCFKSHLTRHNKIHLRELAEAENKQNNHFNLFSLSSANL